MTNQTPRSNQRTLQQERAAHAWKKVVLIRNNQRDDVAKSYGQLTRSLPSMIQHDGLGPTLAFLLAKAKNKQDNYHYWVYDHLSQWVMGKLDSQSPLSLLEWILADNRTTRDYRRAANEATAYLNWLKRFAEAEGLV